jgi:hypothetical protein
MGRVAKPEALKAMPVMEVKVLTISPDINRSSKISLMLGRYQGDIPSTNFMRPHD